jgi:Pyruvate/2-oxoacid:ferredoxin oxidoreductase gamma subunit
VTSTTPGGNLERPLDVCATVAVNGAAYVYRGTSFDADLASRMVEAIRTPGFALLDVWELCTAYYVPKNKASRRTLATTLEELGLASGLIQRRDTADYAVAYRDAGAALAGQPTLAPDPLPQRFAPLLDHRVGLVLAGSAGAKVRTAGRLLAEAAVLSGLWAAQRDDYPVTVKTGHSISELILASEPFEYTGISRPDALVLVAPEGLARSRRRLLERTPEQRLYAAADLEGIEGGAPLLALDVERVPHGGRALALLAAALVDGGALAPEALEAAAREAGPAHAEESLRTIRAGLDALVRARRSSGVAAS